MSDRTVAQKLMIKPGHKVLLVHPPAGYEALLGELLPGATIVPDNGEPADVIQVFVADRRELEAQLGRLKALLRPKGMLWVSYHKGTSTVKTDINRDTINAYAQTLGLVGVAMIAVDDDWAALRLKLV